MSSDDDIRAIDRFVAGLPVEEAALAAALAARAIDRAIVVDAMLLALESPEDAVRLRAAERAARMDDLSPRIAAALRLVAAHDLDHRVRAEAAASLRAHEALVSGEAASRAAGTEPGRPPLVSLWLRVFVMRSGPDERTSIEPSDPASAPGAEGELDNDQDGLVRIRLKGLAGSFVGTRPTVRVRRESGLAPLVTAVDPVDAAGSVTIIVPREAGTNAEVIEWISDEIELVVDAA